MAANNIYIQVDLNSSNAQTNVNALNSALAQTGPTSEKSAKQTTAALSSVNVQVNQTTKAFGELQTALAGLGIARVVSSIVQVGSEVSRAQVMMEAFTGSAQDATKVFEQIYALSQREPFKFKDLEETGRQLLAFGFQAKDVAPTLKIIADQVAATGGSIENVNSIVKVFGRVMDKDFVGAMDLLRLLPANAVRIGDALKKALGAADMQEVQKTLKEGALDPMKTLTVVLQAMQERTKGAGSLIRDFANTFKKLGDVADYVYTKLMGDQGFGPALAKLGDEIEKLLAPLAGLIDLLMKLPEPTKEKIVNYTALTAALIGLGGAFMIIANVAAPAASGLIAVSGALAKMLLVVLANPEILLAVGTITAGLAIWANQFPEQAKKLETTATKWISDMWGKLKDTVTRLAKESGLFPKDLFETPDVKGGDPTVETETNFKAVQKQVNEWATAAGRTMLQALGAPADAVAAKYADLFAKLNDLIKDKVIKDPAHIKQLTDQLTEAQTMETQAKIFEEQKKHIDAVAKLDEERIKGSYELQIAYIEALDQQDLRSKVAAIDHITDLRVQSAKEVAKVEDDELTRVYKMQEDFITAHATLLTSEGVDVEQALADLRKQMTDKQNIIIQKAIDEEQKYRLEGWKKANDAIIEDQKRIFDAFKSEFDEIFDAFTQKSKSIGQALGDVFKKLALGEAREIFSSQLAGVSTELAGYGRPEPGIMRGGGILSQLFQRGMPPRAPGPPPEAYTPVRPSASQPNFENVSGANRTISDAAGVYNVSAVVFSDAVNRFSNATIQHQGSADRMMASSADISEASDAIQKASVATGVSPTLLRAMVQTESNFNAAAISPAGAMGLMQLMPGTAKKYGATDPFNIQQNVTAGATYFSDLLSRYSGNLPSALAAYNMGPAAFEKTMARGGNLPQETRLYVQRVQALTAQGDLGQGAPAAQVLRQFQMPPAVPSGIGGADLPSLAEPPVVTPQFAAPGQLPTALLGKMGSVEIAQVEKMAGVGGGGGSGGSQSLFAGLLKLGAAPGQLASLFGIATTPMRTGGEGILGLPSINRAAQAQNLALGIGGPTTLKSILTSRGVEGIAGMAATMGGAALFSKGLQQYNAPATALGGGLVGAGTVLMNPKLLAGGPMAIGAGAAAGVGLGLFASGFQKGGAGGLAMDVGGGALAGAGIGFLAGGPLGAAIGAGIGAVAGAITGVVRLFVKTEQEKIRAQIKQVYGIDISNRQILTQIQQIVDQNYGGNVAVGVRSSQVQDLVRLYALSTGQAANMPRPMYAATIAQSTQGLQLQPVYQGGTQVPNPYSGPTTYQYQTAVAAAGGLLPGFQAGSGMGVPGAQGLINTSFQQLTLEAIRGNPSAIAMSNSAAATAGDSRLTTTAAMQEPLTLLS